jgi:hypothetical protein
MARVADLYRDSALRFTCDETIYYATGGRSSLHKFRYIYRRSEDGKLVDYRTPRGRAEERSEKSQQRARLENYGLPMYMARAYSWLFVFERHRQQHYRFTLEGDDEALGRAAICIRFEARSPEVDAGDAWSGSAWIDRESHQLLRVEAVHAGEQRQRVNLQRVIEATPEPGSPIERGSFTYTLFTTDFDVTENGMRFPGKVTITRSRHNVTGVQGKGKVTEAPIFTISQTYKRYRFFGVRTSEQVRAFVEGAGNG